MRRRNEVEYQVEWEVEEWKGKCTSGPASALGNCSVLHEYAVEEEGSENQESARWDGWESQEEAKEVVEAPQVIHVLGFSRSG